MVLMDTYWHVCLDSVGTWWWWRWRWRYNNVAIRYLGRCDRSSKNSKTEALCMHLVKTLALTWLLLWQQQQQQQHKLQHHWRPPWGIYLWVYIRLNHFDHTLNKSLFNLLCCSILFLQTVFGLFWTYRQHFVHFFWKMFSSMQYALFYHKLNGDAVENLCCMLCGVYYEVIAIMKINIIFDIQLYLRRYNMYRSEIIIRKFKVYSLLWCKR